MARHLENDLKTRGIVVNREVKIRKGQETDIHIVAIRENQDRFMDQVKVITEVKGFWLPEMKTAMETQLRERYLRENKYGHGLYLAMWFLISGKTRTEKGEHLSGILRKPRNSLVVRLRMFPNQGQCYEC